MTAAAPADVRTRPIPARPGRILVADDEHLIATDLVMTLGELGYSVVGPATDGEAAVELARATQPDLALLDIQMPRCDGLMAARRIFEELFVPVVILSAYSDEEYVDSARGAGVFGYLVKPTSANQLRAGIDVAWGRYLRARDDEHEIAELEQKLEDRRIIERAKWILVARKSVSEEEAMRMLQRQARQSRRRIVEVAQQLLDASELL